MNIPLLDPAVQAGPQQTITDLREQVRELTSRLDVSGARYEAMKRLVPVGFCSVGPDGLLQHTSPSAAVLLGLRSVELVGQPVTRFVASQDLDAFHAMRDALLATGEPQAGELRMVQANGTRLWAEVMAALAPEPRQGAQFHMSLNDITRRKQAQVALEQSEERFRRLTELSSDWYWEQDAEYRFVQISGGDPAPTDGPAAATLGSRLWEVAAIHPPAGGWALHQALVHARLPFHELALQLDDQAGRARWMSVSGVPFFAEGGEFLGYRGIGRDISAERQAATARQEALDRLQKIASRVPGMVYQYRLRSDNSTCYPFASEAIRDLFGLAPQDVREDGRAIAQMIDPQDGDRMRLGIRQSAQDLSPWHAEFRIRRADGSQRWMAANAIPEREPGGSTLWNGFASDITEHKLAQEAIRTALQEKSTLLQEVHHRVKNNLQVVVSLLRLEGQRGRNDAVRHVLDDMQGRIRAMALLHESLYRTDVFATVRLEHYLRELATQAFRAATRDNLVRLQLDLEPVQVGLHQGTPCGLIVNELISNCLKHGFPDGRSGVVSVSLRSVPHSKQVCLQVSDSGVGFPAGFAGQALPSLGLQLVSDLCDQLGGSLDIGPGSTVAVRFTPDQPSLTRDDSA